MAKGLYLHIQIYTFCQCIIQDIEAAENTGRVAGHEQKKEHLYEDKSYQVMRAALRDSLAHANPHRVPAHLKLYAALAGLLGFRLHGDEADLVLTISSFILVKGLCIFDLHTYCHLPTTKIQLHK